MNPRPDPRYRLSTLPVTCSTDVPALSDSISDPAALPAPVPVLVSAQPSPPVARAYPSAALTAVASCRTGTNRRCLLTACTRGWLWTLTIPKTVSTPASRSTWTSRSPPLPTCLSFRADMVFLSDIARDASADVEAGARHVGRAWRQQGHDHGGHLVGAAEPAEADTAVLGDLRLP